MLSANVCYTLLVFAVGLLCQLGFLPWFLLGLTVTGVFSRWAFAIHHRTHSQATYPIWEELMLLLTGPISVGMNEHRAIHQKHHAYVGSELEHLDAESLFYRTPPLLAFLLCCLHPEITFFRLLPGMSAGAIGRAVLRCLLFLTCWHFAGVSFLLWYLLPIRVLWAVSQFVFTWVLHHRIEARTVNLMLPDWLTFLVGKEGMKEFRTHVSHHARSRQAQPASKTLVAV